MAAIERYWGKVKNGEKPHIVVFYRWLPQEKTEPEEFSQLVLFKPKKKPHLRYYWVYNVDQCEKIPDRFFPVVDRRNDPIEVCEDIVFDMPEGPAVVFNDPSAYYHTIEDYINMPKPGTFKDSESYYRVFFHELIHSTGHASRLKRKQIADWTPFGTEAYSFEELVAEMGACYLSSYAGIAEPDLTNSVVYLQSWLLRLKNDKRLIIQASAKAQQAVDFILRAAPSATDEGVTEVVQQEE